MRIFSIDPGLSGAWALIVDGRAETCGDMPVAGEGSQRRVSASVLAHIMRDCTPDLCVIELVHAMPGNGVSGMFKFGMAYGAAIATANIVGVPLELVTPQTWKRNYRLGKDKEASRQKALDLAPGMADLLRRKLDQGRAEAILIGLWGAQAFDTARAA